METVVEPGVGRGAVARFLAANRHVCNDVLRPRLYPIGHRSALDILTARGVADRYQERRESLLEFGCGRTFHFCRLVGQHFSALHGTDIEEIPDGDRPPDVEFRRCGPEQIPWGDAAFVAVVISSVIEHVENPGAVFRELDRVMKPGARLFMNLPNKWDYVSIAARVLGRSKGKVLRGVVGMGYDEFPVHYRCNTRGSLEAALAGTRLSIETFRPVPSEPVYLAFFLPFYLVGLAYQFLISTCCLDFLQPAFFVVLKKSDDERPQNG